MASVGHIAVDHRAGLDDAVCPYGYARHDDGARADAGAFADPRVEIDAPRHVMGEDNCLMVDHATSGDVDALGPRPVNQRGRRDPCRGVYVHLPQAGLDQPLPLLPQCHAAGR